MEIEAKFRVDDSNIFTWLKSQSTIGTYHLHPYAQSQEQHNIYYDTADGTLQQAHYGLRIREMDGEHIATLKSSGDVQDGISVRGEWEVAAADPHPATWPESEARTRAHNLLGDAPLVPLITVHTYRHAITVMHSGCEIAEVSLDEGTISAAGRTLEFRELEVEMLPLGTRVDFDTFLSELRKQAVLIPENRSKLDRGLQLLHGEYGEE